MTVATYMRKGENEASSIAKSIKSMSESFALLKQDEALNYKNNIFTAVFI